MAVFRNIDDINAALLEVLEELVVGIMNGNYDDETDENLVRVVASLLSAIDNDSTPSAEALSPDPEHVESTPAPEEAPLGDAEERDAEKAEQFEVSTFLAGDALSPKPELVDSTPVTEDAPLDVTATKEDDTDVAATVAEESTMSLATDTPSGGDAPFSDLGPADPTPIPEDGPLGDVVMPEVLGAEIEPAKGMAVTNSHGELVGGMDPPATTGKCVSPRRSRLSAGWKRVKRISRALCCWRCDVVRSSL